MKALNEGKLLLRVTKKGSVLFPLLKFYNMDQAVKIRQYELRIQEDGNVYVRFYDVDGKLIPASPLIGH